MNYIKHLSGFFNKIVNDNDLNPTHISLYLALFQSWNLNRFQNPISITRNEMMRISKIFSKATYHKCVNDLHGKGYINYEPSHNPFKGSLVWVINLETNILAKTKKETRRSKNRQPIEHVTEHVIEQVVNKQQTSTLPTPRQALVPSINNINNTNIKNKKNIVNERTQDEKIKTEKKQVQNLNEPFEKKKKLREKKEMFPTPMEANPNQTKNGRQMEIFEIIPPRLEDVQTFFKAMAVEGNEPERFFNHFQSNGWLVGGKSKMKNWQASAKNWILNLSTFNPTQVAAASNPVPGNLKTSKHKNYDEPL
uniref:transcriptional regulator n=1 Tax=Flavobacterium sp. TaxID=239 RepID=UPI004049CC80